MPTYLSLWSISEGSPAKIHLFKSTPRQSIQTILETVKLAEETWACITKFGFNICKSCAKNMSKFFSKCAVLRHWHSTIYRIKLLLYTGLSKKKKSITIMLWILDLKEHDSPREEYCESLKLVLNFTTYRFLTTLKLFSIITENIKNLSYITPKKFYFTFLFRGNFKETTWCAKKLKHVFALL